MRSSIFLFSLSTVGPYILGLKPLGQQSVDRKKKDWRWPHESIFHNEKKDFDQMYDHLIVPKDWSYDRNLFSMENESTVSTDPRFLFFFGRNKGLKAQLMLLCAQRIKKRKDEDSGRWIENDRRFLVKRRLMAASAGSLRTAVRHHQSLVSWSQGTDRFLFPLHVQPGHMDRSFSKKTLWSILSWRTPKQRKERDSESSTSDLTVHSLLLWALHKGKSNAPKVEEENIGRCAGFLSFYNFKFNKRELVRAEGHLEDDAHTRTRTANSLLEI